MIYTITNESDLCGLILLKALQEVQKDDVLHLGK